MVRPLQAFLIGGMHRSPRLRRGGWNQERVKHFNYPPAEPGAEVPKMNAIGSKVRRQVLLTICLMAWQSDLPLAKAQTFLRNVCRVKGQEENVLRGWGLVVGLNGTGEANDPQTMRALAIAMANMGSPLPQQGLPGQGSLDELKKIKNVAYVMVTATVPATGARRGDKVDCSVSAINGKSLEGGRLAFAALKGPNVQDPRVYALAEGAIDLEDPEQPLAGTIHNGCQMEADIFTPFDENGYVTLILDRNHANFQTATDVAEYIRQTSFQEDPDSVVAKSASNIVIKIPDAYKKDVVAFISGVMETPIYSPEPEARVVINPRTGSIVISGDVQIGDVVVSHKNIVVDANVQVPPFKAIDQQRGSNSAKLSALVDALSALKVPTSDAIDIIKTIERSGKLHGRLIIE